MFAAHVLYLSSYLHGLKQTCWVNNCICCFSYLQYPRPVCLVCCILGCNFPSISSIPTYLHVLPPKLGQNLHVAAHITFQFSGPHQPFTWLQTSIWIDFAENSQAWKNGKSNQKTKKESQHPALIPRLKLVKIKRFWRNSTQQNSKAGTQDQDPTKQMAFVQWARTWWFPPNLSISLNYL